MKQDFKILIRHFAAYGIGIYLSKLIGFFMIPIYTSYLSPADYGVLELLDLTMYLFAMFVSLGFAHSIIRFYADCRNDREKSEVVSTAFGFISLIAVVCGLVLIYLARPVSEFIFSTAGESSSGPEELAYFLRIITCSQVMELISITGIAYMQAEKKSTLFTSVSVGKFIIAVSFNILFIVGMGMGVKGVLYSGFIANAAFLVAVTLIVRKRLAWAISMPLATNMLKFGAPLILSSLSMYIIHFADRYFLERNVGLSLLGIYSLSYKFAMILPALVYAPFEMIWNAQKFDLYKKGEDGRKTINYFNKYMVLFSVFFICVFSLGIKDLIMVMADPRYHEAYHIVPPLLIAFMFTGLASISEVGILYAKKTIYRGLGNLYGAIVALAGYYLLIPIYGYWGAVITTLAALFVRYITLTLYGRKFYRIAFSPEFFWKPIAAGGITYLLVSMIRIDNHYLSFFSRVMAGTVLFVALSFLLKIFNRYELEAARSIMNRFGRKVRRKPK